ncbi:3'-5' exonuclease, related [Eimeria tenella]|uniref:3'-5' exonuclease, related n=1 Tax=Eimeria tenella TaxID=5802 RepID=U6KX15_EIMTE|nr:3'-5' exonuclease, related [Eimeria tenella]CDJ42496.1 3'-5' exonuclease, related [Eimeria tenella]|eukprot:XP_013233246.1 3'-5' exonuclease, related [Eimeria tenella]
MAGEGDRFDYIEQLWRDAVAAGVEPLLSFPQRRWKEYISNFSCAFEAQQPTDLLNGITRQKPRVNRNITYQGFLALEALVKERPPCEHEIQNAKMHFFEAVDEDPFKDVSEFTFVENDEQLAEMIEDITEKRKSSAVAIDVEHHSQASYRGFTCLIQVCTATHIYIIDSLNVFEKLFILNKITADASIVKVLHNGDNDITWLQRDFNVYIINAFDTGKAAKFLHIEGGTSLKNVLALEFNEHKEEWYKTCDWSNRPLTRGMLQYAVNDIRKTNWQVHAYEKEVKAMLCKPFTFPKYKDLEKILRAPQLRRPTGKKRALAEAVLAWRDIRSRSIDCSRTFLISPHELPRAINQAYHAKTGAPIARCMNNKIGEDKLREFAAEIDDLVIYYAQ